MAIFGLEAKQLFYIIGLASATVIAMVSIYLFLLARHKLKNTHTSELSKDDELKIKLSQELQDLENKQKGKKKIISVKHRAASTASGASGAAKRVLKAKLAQYAIADEASVIEEPDTKVKPFDAIRTGKSKFSVKFWKNHFLERLHPDTTALISMELMNGFHRLFIVKEKDEGFKYRGRKYLFDNEAKYYVIDTKLWCYDYHENFVLPVKRKIPLTSIKKSLEASNISEVEYATNPSTLERFTISKIAEGIMKGQAIDEFMKQIRLLLIIAMASSLIHLVLFMFKSGMLQQIKIPGVTG